MKQIKVSESDFTRIIAEKAALNKTVRDALKQIESLQNYMQRDTADIAAIRERINTIYTTLTK